LFESMCAYDLVGLQTQSDVQAFVDYAARYLGATIDGNRIQHQGRWVKVDAYPIGIQPQQVKDLSKQAARSKEIDSLKEGLQQRKLIISVDRLDYSKGLVERFNAFERLLETYPSHCGRVSFLQIAPPSRSDVEGYRHIRRQLESTAGHINGRWTELSW